MSQAFVLSNHFFDAALLINQSADTKIAPVQIHCQMPDKIAQDNKSDLASLIQSQVTEKKTQIAEAIK